VQQLSIYKLTQNGLVLKKGYEDPILKTEVTVGSTDVIIYAKYEQNTIYDGLVRYFVGQL